MKENLAIRSSVLILFLFSGWATAANKVLRLIGEEDSYFEVPDHDSLDVDLEIAFTMEAWVNPEITDGENLVINKEDSYEIGVVNGMFDTAIRPDGQTWAWSHSGAEVPTDEWSHLAATWDGDIINMFLNGEWYAEAFLTGDAINDSPDTLKIGRRTRGDETHSSFEGLVDEVRISNIVRYTDAGFDVPTSAFVSDENTVALYHFDEANNGVVMDASSFGNHGELLGDATLVEDDFLASGGDPGDFDGSGSLDIADIDALVAAAANDTAFDLTGDGTVDQADLNFWVKDLKNTWIGDSNLDGEFNSSDFVSVFTSGKFEQDIDASWSEGDWTGDGRFNSSDFVAAFTDGGFELGPRTAAANVPEPHVAVASALAFSLFFWFARRRNH